MVVRGNIHINTRVIEVIEVKYDVIIVISDLRVHLEATTAPETTEMAVSQHVHKHQGNRGC